MATFQAEVGIYKSRTLGYGQKTFRYFLGLNLPFFGGGGGSLRVSSPNNAYVYLPVVSAIALQFVRDVFGFGSFSPLSVLLLSVALEGLFRDLQLLQLFVVALKSEKKSDHSRNNVEYFVESVNHKLIDLVFLKPHLICFLPSKFFSL